MTEIKKTGERIATARKALGLSQQELADKVGVSFQAVSKWERGSSLPDVALLPALARALGVGVDHLLTGTPEPDPSGEQPPRPMWGHIRGTVTKDIHGDVGNITGNVEADIYGDVKGDIMGQVRNVFGNVEGKILGLVKGDITGYVGGSLFGTVEGHVKLGVRGKVMGTVIGDGINVGSDFPAQRIARAGIRRGAGRRPPWARDARE